MSTPEEDPNLECTRAHRLLLLAPPQTQRAWRPREREREKKRKKERERERLDEG